ncbi:hypothetical protein OIU85_020623 [Salix viminalis]|uniref:Uncharacterized protein n=1 Tax=Salix viminalis TaxID=40686 RepID=A0A9Q0ZCS0_SALVM|nr:hypothetical protein OIU85_020623 [Salix viminalis]
MLNTLVAARTILLQIIKTRFRIGESFGWEINSKDFWKTTVFRLYNEIQIAPLLTVEQNARDAKQIHGSPLSWLCNAARETETVPHQFPFQATNVYYGGRPDKKKILSECKGSSPGVLVGGPKMTRHKIGHLLIWFSR